MCRLRLLSLLLIMGIILSACSNDSDVSKEMTEKGDSIHSLQNEDYIMIHKEDAPLIRQQPDVQLWEYVSDFSLAEENGWFQETTSWKSWGEDIEPVFLDPNIEWESPGLLLNTWVSDLWLTHSLGFDVAEITQRIHYINDTTVEGYVLSYGFNDDTISGIDFKVKMVYQDGTWMIDDVKERQRCRRGVSEDELCV